MSEPRRGEVCWVQLDPTVGAEINKTRHAVVISNDVGNQHSPRVIVAPITSRTGEQVYPFEVLIPQGEGGLERTSKVLLNQVRTVDKVRLRQRAGVLHRQRMLEVDRAIRLSLAV